MAKGKERGVLYRVVKFEICPDEAQLAVLRKISDNLWLVWNEALQERQTLFDTYIAPLYERIKEALERQDVSGVSGLRKELALVYKEHKITLFDQINALTSRRHNDSAFARVPRNWQEETLDALDGAYKSFIMLRKNGDPKARTPRLKSAEHFCEIPGRFGFKVIEGKDVALLCGNLADDTKLLFPIPELYQQGKLARAVGVKKFTLYRDESDMRKPGRFWISLAYEIPKPEERPFMPEEAVYISLGASSIGIVSPKGEELIKLWRSDKYWKPTVDSVDERMKQSTKGSRKWHKRRAAKLKMLRIMSAQQKQDRREIVATDLLEKTIGDLVLGHGVHFVVTDLVVRSKKGKLADASKPERGGQLGLNWSAQNTGSIAYLVQWLEEKAKEHGGTVRRHRLLIAPPNLPQGHENKIAMARALRDEFLRTLEKTI